MKEIVVHQNTKPDNNRLKENVSLRHPDGTAYGAARPIFRTRLDRWPLPTWDPAVHAHLSAGAGADYFTLLPSDTINADGIPAARNPILAADMEFFSGVFDWRPSSVDSGWNGWGWSFDTPPGLIGLSLRATLTTVDGTNITGDERVLPYGYFDIYEDAYFSGGDGSNYTSSMLPNSSLNASSKSVYIEATTFVEWSVSGLGMQPTISLPAASGLTKDLYLTRANIDVFHMADYSLEFEKILTS